MEPQVQVSAPVTTLIAPLQLLKNAYSFYKKHFKVVIALFIIPVVLEVVLLVLEQVSLSVPDGSPEQLGILGGKVLFTIAQVVVGILATFGFLKVITELNNDLPFEGIKISYKKGAHLIWPLIVAGALSGVASIGAFFFFIVPVVIIGIYLSAVQFVVIEENEKGMKALLKSWGYVNGRWSAVFGRYMFLALISLAIVAAVLIVLVPIVLSMPDSQMEHLPSKLATFAPLFLVGNVVLGFIGTLFLQPLLTIYYYLLYRDLKATQIAPMSLEKERSVKNWLTFFMIFAVVAGVAFVALLTMASVATH